MDNWHVDKDTKLYFSVSSKPGNFGASLYNAAFRECGINAIYKPLKLEDPQMFPLLLSGLHTINASGLSVSMPFKRTAKNLSWSTHTDAFQIGNCNTITFEDGSTYGDNTDWVGFTLACENILDKSKGAVIYGTGAVADSIAFALDKKRIPFRMINRKDVYLLSKNEYSDFLINATLIGMDGVEDNVFTEDIVSQYNSVFDAVVSKERTNLVQLGDKVCKHTVRGITMSFYQLCKQFRIYTGHAPPEGLFSEIIQEKYGVQI